MSRCTPLAILTLALLVLTGCAGTATEPTTMAPTVEPTVTASPVPTPTAPPAASPSSDLSALAARYTTIAAGGRAAVRQCDREKAAGSGSLTDDKAIARACRDGYVTYIAALKAVAWGPAQAQANAVISAAEACDALVVEMLNAPDWSTFSAAYDRLPAAEDHLVLMADAMRKALGLPPAY
jgi:hypothetical protein